MSDYPQENIENRIIEKRIGKFVKQTEPQVSVVIPCYNSSALIAETLQTVFAQSYSDYEVILINDGSPDTEKLEKNIEKFFDKIVYIKQKNTGAAGARNTGIHHSRGTYIAFLDGDDLWLPTYLESQISFLLKNDLQMIYCDAILIGSKAWEGKTYMDGAPSDGRVTAKTLISTECNVITSGTMVEKNQLTARNGFDESAEATRVEDFDLWVGLAKQGCRIGYQKEALLKYRISNTGLSGDNVSRAERTVQALKLVKKKNVLSDEETKAMDDQIKISEAYLELEKGKFCLLKEDFEQSLIHLANANRFFHKKKIMFVIWLIKIKPGLAKALYQSLRANELEFSLVQTD